MIGQRAPKFTITDKKAHTTDGVLPSGGFAVTGSVKLVPSRFWVPVGVTGSTVTCVLNGYVNGGSSKVTVEVQWGSVGSTATTVKLIACFIFTTEAVMGNVTELVEANCTVTVRLTTAAAVLAFIPLGVKSITTLLEVESTVQLFTTTVELGFAGAGNSMIAPVDGKTAVADVTVGPVIGRLSVYSESFHRSLGSTS
jgi:hypothetical protein